MSEEITNQDALEAVDPVVETPTVEDAPIVEEPKVEEPKVEEPVFEEPKAEEPKAQAVVTGPSYPAKEDGVQALGAVAGGVIGATKAKPVAKKPAKKAAAKPAETVALYSTRNVTWGGVGKVYRGYNIVEKAAADKWLTRDHVRLATPEEVAKEYGK